MPTIQHSLSDVIADLDAKISALEAKKADVPSGHPVLQDINNSIEKAQAARSLLLDSCCTTQGCNFTY